MAAILQPALRSAWLLRIPVWLHEQNAVMGRTNQLVVQICQRRLYSAGQKQQACLPATRHAIQACPLPLPSQTCAHMQIKKRQSSYILLYLAAHWRAFVCRYLATGYCQVTNSLKSIVRITQQARSEQIDALRSTYAAQNIFADISPFSQM